MYVLVVGGGQIGGHVAQLLLASGCQVTIIEPREAALARVRQDSPGSLIVAGSGTDPAPSWRPPAQPGRCRLRGAPARMRPT
ncbi:MAG: TrkA family potassium uptake protein [Propionibacteriaceae bacterium]|nr:TrkA family potassium uptake protein [Propionibacteriaceae bacterium]